MARSKVNLWCLGTFCCISILITQTILWMLDREPPYRRVFGVMQNGEPMECGPNAKYYDDLTEGGCAAIEWTLELHPVKISHCVPTDSLHVSRTVTDADGEVHTLKKTPRYFGPGKEPFRPKIRRPLILPEYSTPAIYHSEACFICNPVDWIIPNCVTTPDVLYEAKREEQRP